MTTATTPLNGSVTSAGEDADTPADEASLVMCGDAGLYDGGHACPGRTPHRHPSSGATYLRMLSMTCALYSTPNWFGTVRSSVSAAAIASSSASCLTSASGSAA